MATVRHLLNQRHLAILICAATLLLKLLVPTGYMIDDDHGRMVVTICSGSASAPMTMAMPRMPDHGKSHGHGKADAPCAFSGLSAAAIDAIGPIQLAALIAFVFALGVAAAIVPAASAPLRLRPPLRGPPAGL